MIKAVLRRGDGLPSGRPWLRSVVRSVQEGLVQAGHALEPDGKFGGGTKRVVEDFQREAGIEPDGVAGRVTWTALDAYVDATVGAHEREVQALLERFDGDLDWIHEREGHRGRPYWPGGASGVTLDPGVDLGHIPPDRAEELFAPLLSRAQMRTLSQVYGIKGDDARTALNVVEGLKDIRISREQAFELMPYAAKPYWDGVTRRFPAVRRAGTPPSVRTVMLSLAYNRGVFNPGLEPLGTLLESRDWAAVARTVGAMQQRHRLEGIRVRRREEASLIVAELDFLGLA